MWGSVGDVMSVIPPSFPGIKITPVPSPLDGRLNRLVTLRQTRDGIMVCPLGEHLGFGMGYGRYTSATNRTRVTSIHGVNFSFNAMASGESPAIFLIPKYPGRFDCLVGAVQGHGRSKRGYGGFGGFGGFGGSGSGAFGGRGRGREARHYGNQLGIGCLLQDSQGETCGLGSC